MSSDIQTADALPAESSNKARTLRSRHGTTWMSWPMLLGAFVYGLVAFKGGVLRDGDTFWHIAAGRWILDHQRVPDTDPFSHTMPGAAWTAHEWLCEVILAVAHDVGGWTSVAALTALVFAATIALLVRALLARLEPTRAVLFAVLAILMTMSHLIARPHVLAMPLLVAWCAELARARDEQRGPRLWMLPLMTLWANMHAGFVLGIGLAGAFALEAVLQGRRDGRAEAAIRPWASFVALSVGCALLTPHGLQIFSYTWDLLTQHQLALDTISEWASPDFHRFQPMELWLLAALALALGTGLKLPPIRLVLVLGLIHMSLKHARHIELLGLVVPLLVAAPLGTQWRDGSTRLRKGGRLAELSKRLAQPASTLAVIGLVGLMGVATALQARLAPVIVPEQAAPQLAVQAARAAGASGPVLNAYDWGGYLIYAGVPPYIDGRAEMYGNTFFREYFDALYLQQPGTLEKVLATHKVTWTLLVPGTPAIALLDCLPGWRRVYADDIAVVHVKTDA